MITQRAVLVGIVGFCLYLIALVNALPSFFYILTWMSVGILVSSGGLALLSLLGLQCRWHVTQKTGVESPVGTRAEGSKSASASGPALEISITNTGTLNKINTLIDVRVEHVGRGTQTTQRFLIEALPSGTALSSTLILNGLPRGRYKIVSLRIAGSDVLGLFRARQLVAMPGEEETVRPFWSAIWGRKRDAERRTIEILVVPATTESGVRDGHGHSIAAGEEAASSDLLGRSDEMRGTRPYVAGDDLRSVHWKSTARLGRLVVREFDRLARPQCLVLWDGGRGWGEESESYEAFGDASPIELGLRLTASLCGALAAQNRPCALLRLDSRPAHVATERGMSRVQLTRCLESLAGADAGRETPLPAALASRLKELESAGEIFLVSAAPHDELKDAIVMLRRLGLRVSLGVCDTAKWPRLKARRRKGAPFWELRGAVAPSAPLAPADIESLAALGARVAVLAPSDESFWNDSSPVLRRALLDLMGTQRIRRPSQESGASAARESVGAR